MSAPRLQLPTLQNWSCHNCGGCCRQHLIEITAEERQRIERQGWTAADGLPEGQSPVVRMGGGLGKPRYRLAHRADGACVFLDDRGLCRIHAKFGEAAKPLACRLYPYAFHPAGNQVTVSLRFSCPSVVANRGKAVAENQAELKRLAAAVVPKGAADTPPPAINGAQRVEWPDFLRFIAALDDSLAETDAPVMVRLVRTLFWMRLVGQAKFDAIRGGRIDELLGLLRDAAKSEVPTDLTALPEPTRAGRMQFRMLVAQYARSDTAADLDRGWRNRWRLLRAAWQFARGTGNIPPLQDAFRPVPFAALEQPFGPLPDDAEEILTRYLRVKVQGLHFCGPAYYGVPLVEGFQSLALIVPAMLWLARWLAASDGRDRLTTDDLRRAVALADHHHGYSPALGQSNARRRVRLLTQTDDIARLCAWYAR